MTDAWSLVYEGYDPAQEGLREALCTLGNGFFATRGAAPEAHAGDEGHYPGTYVAGLYNRLETSIAGRTIDNEDLVNVPNWLPTTYRIDGGDWFHIDRADVEEFRQELDLRRGILIRQLVTVDTEGRRTRLTQRRLVHQGHEHVAALQTTVQAVDWSGTLTLRSGVDGDVENLGVPRYRDLAHRHLEGLRAEVDEWLATVLVRTSQSHVEVAVAARHRVLRDGEPQDVAVRPVQEAGWVGHELDVELEPGGAVTLEKIVGLATTRDRAIAEPVEAARGAASRGEGFDELLDGHVLAWDHLWGRFDLDLGGADDRTQLILRLHVFHLLQTVSPNTIDLDVGVPARGLHGEAYRGHIFWDELFIFPFLNLRLPVLTRSLLMYRRRRLDEARAAAAAEGYDGAMYPWQSGSSGREESQRLHLNPRSGNWLPDHSHLQRHIGIAVAYNMWQYVEVSGDLQFLRFHAAEVIVEIARFFASLTTYDRAGDRYEILGVMGPDEYHEAYPDRDEPGLDNNAYTNVMVVWVLRHAVDLLELLPPHHREELWEELRLTREEIDRWEHISRRMRVVFHDGVISQFEGYDQLEEFDWEGYRERYGDIQRLDRILEAEDDTPNRYKLSKQADVLMLFYLLTSDELVDLLDRLGYEFDPSTDIPRNVEYYLERTSHGSTLSKVVHSWVLARSDRERSWRFFCEALVSDVSDVQGGTTAEGIHLGAMAGTVDLVQRGFTGIATHGDVLRFEPSLPPELGSLDIAVHYRGQRVTARIRDGELHLRSEPGPAAPIRVAYGDREATLEAGGMVSFAG